MEQSICFEDLKAFRADSSNPVSRLAARAASKSSVNDICYDTEHAKRMNHKFSVDIPTMGACNQKSSGRCWLFAALNILREKVGKDLKLEQFELSQSYLSFYDHLEKANTFLERIVETAHLPVDDRYVTMLLTSPMGDGGWWEYFAALCKKYGAVPKEAMPETYQSSNTGSMNKLISMQLRKDAVQIRKEMAAGKTPEEIRELKSGMLSKIYNVLTVCLGTPPECFDFEYVDKEKQYHADRNLTPQSFYDKYIGQNLSDIVCILNAPTAATPFYKTYRTAGEEDIFGSGTTGRLNLPVEEFKAAVIRQLQAGEPVWFAADCGYYGNRDEGIWDTGLYDYETLFGLDLAMDKGDLLDYRQCTLSHAMLLTGVNLVDGKPDKWKIQNSWGTDKGNKGYYIMSDDWFNQYVFTASIDKKYLTEAQRPLFDEEPVVLPPWNVLG